MREIIPIAFLPENHALAIAAMSYNGKLDFGLLGDYDAMPDMDFVADAIEETTAELLAAARGEGPGPVNTRGRTSRPRSSRPASTAG
jgi:hypothetical protein